MKLASITDDVVYHGTTSKFLPTIRRNGIKPGLGGGADDHAVKTGFGNFKVSFNEVPDRQESVFLSISPAAASVFGAKAVALNGGECVVLKIELPPNEDLMPDEAGGRNSRRYVGTIDPSWIRAVYVVDNDRDELVPAPTTLWP